MRSIRKIVSTPVKWASRELLHRTLLTFPGGNADDPVACAFCPEMCRFACPTAVTSGNDAVTPAAKMGLLHARRKWPDAAARLGEPWPVFDCTGCGRCTEYCVYEVSVADHLFSARDGGAKGSAWDRAREAGSTLDDAMDPWGDLAAELGWKDAAERRTRAVSERARGAVTEVSEPKAVFHLGMAGVSVALSWQSLLLMGADGEDPRWPRVCEALAGRRWVVYESVWLSRRLGRHEQVRQFARQAVSKGVDVRLSSETRADLEDAGGEGAYRLLFAEAAVKMASEWWERARRRTGADAILSMSPRASSFFRKVLGDAAVVLDAEELLFGCEAESRGAP